VTGAHFASLAELAAWLSGKDAMIRAYRYDGFSFGYWNIVVTRYTERIHCTWDGRDGVLSIETGRAFETKLDCEWKPVLTVGAANSAEAFVKAEEFIKKSFTP
jgi:hypothetical protein